MKIGFPDLVLNARAELGESPAWDAENQRLFWVNIYSGELHIYNPKAVSDSQIRINEPIGCVVPHRSDSVMLALRTGFAILNLCNSDLNHIINPERHLPGNRFNDGKCDPVGRFLAGTMDNAEKKATGSLYSLDAFGKVTRLLDDVRISNGLTWSPDYKTFYFIDTPKHKVMAYDYDLSNGQIANPRTVIRVPFPDGMTSDRYGRLWIAHWGGARITVWEPKSRRLLDEIPIPALNVTSCVFGGKDLNELYITPALRGMNAARIAAYPASGGLLRIKTNVEGMPSFNAAFQPET